MAALREVDERCDGGGGSGRPGGGKGRPGDVIHRWGKEEPVEEVTHCKGRKNTTKTYIKPHLYRDAHRHTVTYTHWHTYIHKIEKEKQGEITHMEMESEE